MYWIAISIFLVAVRYDVRCQESPSNEYCQDETFEASCANDHIILVDKASYGRAHIGRCVRKNLGFLPCVKDVTNYLSHKCSGKHECELGIMDETLRAYEPCSKEVSWHLQVAYRCVKIETPDVQSPHGCHAPLQLAASTGYLSSHVTSSHGVGLTNCPWSITLQSGQRIQLQALNLLHRGPRGRLSTADICYQFVQVVDNGDIHPLTVCSADPSETVVYTSSTNQLQVYFTQPMAAQTDSAFVLKYSGVGCGHPPTVHDATMTYSQSNSVVAVSCNHSGETWYLTCKHSEWVGKLGICSSTPAVDDVSEAKGWSLFTSMFLVVAIGVALGVFLGGTALVIANYRIKRKQPRYELPPELPTQDYYRDMRAGSIKQLQHGDIQTYGAGLRPHDIIYDTSLIGDVKKDATNSAQSRQHEHRKKGHMYEVPQMM